MNKPSSAELLVTVPKPRSVTVASRPLFFASGAVNVSEPWHGAQPPIGERKISLPRFSCAVKFGNTAFGGGAGTVGNVCLPWSYFD